MKKLKKILDEFEIDRKILSKKIHIEKNNIQNIEISESIDKLICFLISAEDHRFYYHLGFDLIAIARAFRNKIFWDKREGASTIEQQLVRVLTNDYNHSIKRKVKEILLAYSLKKSLTKKEIALIYLNVAYYGTNLEGLKKILGKYDLNHTDVIDDQICAEVIARLKYPEPSNNNTNKINLIEKRTIHIRKLYKKHSSNKYLNLYGKYN